MRKLINNYLGISIEINNGKVIVESEKYNKDINYQKKINYGK